jgi:hypothetical protein
MGHPRRHEKREAIAQKKACPTYKRAGWYGKRPRQATPVGVEGRVS